MGLKNSLVLVPIKKCTTNPPEKVQNNRFRVNEELKEISINKRCILEKLVELFMFSDLLSCIPRFRKRCQLSRLWNHRSESMEKHDQALV